MWNNKKKNDLKWWNSLSDEAKQRVLLVSQTQASAIRTLSEIAFWSILTVGCIFAVFYLASCY